MKRSALLAHLAACLLLLCGGGVASANCRPVAIPDLSHSDRFVVLGTITQRVRTRSSIDAEYAAIRYTLSVEHVYANRWGSPTTSMETTPHCPNRVNLLTGMRVLVGSFENFSLYSGNSVVWRVRSGDSVDLLYPRDVAGSDPRIGAVKTLRQAIALLAPLPSTSTAIPAMPADVGALSVAAALGLLVAMRWRRRMTLADALDQSGRDL